MFKDKKPWLLAIPIIMVDMATFSNVFEGFNYFEHLFPALLVAMAFGVLQIGSLILFSQNLPVATRRWLFFGVALLLSVTGLSNIGLAYLRAAPLLPADELVHVLGFGGGESSLLVGASWIFGLALVICGMIFWTAYGQWLKGHLESRERQESERREHMVALNKMEQAQPQPIISRNGGETDAR